MPTLTENGHLRTSAKKHKEDNDLLRIRRSKLAFHVPDKWKRKLKDEDEEK